MKPLRNIFSHSFFQAAWPYVFLCVVWFGFASPYFLHQLVPYPATYQVNAFSPWGADVKHFGSPVKNNEIPDVITQIYPWKHFTIEMLKKGEIPFWNPYSFSGNLHFANVQSAVFSPTNIFYFFLPFIDAWSIAVLVQPLLAVLSMYLFLKALKLSSIGALIGSIAFGFCGFITVWMPYGTLSLAIAFLPLVLLGIEKSFQKLSIISCLLVTIGITFSLYSGHFQASLYLLLFSGTYIIYKLLLTKRTNVFFGVASCFVLGVIFAYPQLIAAIHFYNASVRSEVFTVSGGIPWQHLITFFVPDFYGNPTTRNSWFGYYAEFASFFGSIPFLFVLFGIFQKKTSTMKFFLFSGMLIMIFALDTPLQGLIGSIKIPVLSTSAPGRIMVLASFSFSVFAAFVFDILTQSLQKKSFLKFASISIGILVTFCIVIFLSHFLPTDKAGIAVKNAILPTGLSVLMLVIFSINLYLKDSAFKNIFYFLLVVLVAFDSLRFAQKWMPFDPKSLVYPDMPIIHALQNAAKSGRVYGNIGNQVETYYGISSIEGYDPLYIQRYGEFIESAEKGMFKPAQRSVARLPRNGKYTDRVLDLLNVATIYHPLLDTDKSWAYPVWKEKERYEMFYKDDFFALYKNTEAMNRATLFYDYEVIADKKKSIERFYSDTFKFRKRLILAEDPKIEKSLYSHKSSVRITSYTPNNIEIAVSSSRVALLFLSDTNYPKWHVFVNGKEQKIYLADYAFRAVVVPKGDSKVEFAYKGPY